MSDTGKLDNLNAFLAKVEVDESLQDQLRAAEDADAVLAICKRAGVEITMEDLLSLQQRVGTTLSDQELESVAGGGGRGQAAPFDTCGSKTCHTSIGQDLPGLSQIKSNPMFNPASLFSRGRFTNRRNR